MSDASQIPNLLSLRGRGGGGRRGLGRGRGGAQRSSGLPAGDSTIQGTDNDAASSRISAVECGYLSDPYATFFDQSIGVRERKLPIIHRGTYTRTSAIDMLVDAFLQGPGIKQIVSLGAGTDTRPYRIFSRQDHPPLIYHELDFEVVTKKKQRITRGNPMLSKILPDVVVSEDGTTWSSHPAEGSEYHCHGIDLRKLVDTWETLPIKGLRADIPTLLLSECCLCYLAPEAATSLLSHFSTTMQDLGTIIYEPIRPNDPFGKVMTANLAKRGIQMPTLEVYPELSNQEQRLKSIGLEESRALTVEDIWKKWIGVEERERVDRLEGLDEVEEWELLAAHYVVAWGHRGQGFEGWESFSR